MLPPYLAIVVQVTSVAKSSAADFSAIWIGGGNNNWSDGTLWSTSPNYPNNIGDSTYDATINIGKVTLDRDITIQRLFINRGDPVFNTTLSGAGTLTLNEGLFYAGGL